MKSESDVEAHTYWRKHKAIIHFLVSWIDVLKLFT